MNERNREYRIKIAQDTLEILKKGSYINKAGNEIKISESLNNAVKKSILYKPSMFDQIEKDIKALMEQKAGNNPKIEVTEETTLGAAKRLVVSEGIKDAVCLNFASAKKPGGGFLSGSQAQEESLARSSGLYPCISQMKEMYDYNWSLKTCLYSDYMIYSPKVLVIRADNSALLEYPYEVSFITAPAVNAGVVRDREAEKRGKIHSVMIERIKKILYVAALNGDKSIVLGAYGCGVFKNSTEDVVGYFRNVLFDQGFKSLFEHITFAIYDNSPSKDKVRVFEKALI